MKKSTISQKLAAVFVAAALLTALFSGLHLTVSAEGPPVYDASFVSEGSFVTTAANFPQDYTFKLPGAGWTHNTVNNATLLGKDFFQAVKSGGHAVTLIDNLGVEYIIQPGYVKDDIPDWTADYDYRFGARYKNGSSYPAIVTNTLAPAAGIEDELTMGTDYVFLEVCFPFKALSRIDIRTEITNGATGTAASEMTDRFYNYAGGGELKAFVYSSSAISPAFPPMPVSAVSGTKKVNLTFTIGTDTSRQFFLTTYDMLPPPSSDKIYYDEKFVTNGVFNTALEDFPENDTFYFGPGAYSASYPGFKKELFQAIKNYNKPVTLIDRSGVRYVVYGNQIAEDIPQNLREEAIEIQSLYKNDTSYQNAISKIGNDSQLSENFVINDNVVVLDVMPVNVIPLAQNSFPVEVSVETRLTGNLSPTSAAAGALADKFYQYAKEGRLYAYTYSKTTQNINEEIPKIKIEADDYGNVIFPVKNPCTLLFTTIDLLTGRDPDYNSNPYEMRIKIGGQNIGDGYTMEKGTERTLELSMDDDISDHTYVWELIGDYQGYAELTEIDGSDNTKYTLSAISEMPAGKYFSVRVTADGDENNFIKTGTISVVYLIYGGEFLSGGCFDTTAVGFPQDYSFTMPSGQYKLTNEFFNAVYESGRKVTVTEPNGVRYIFDAADLAAIPEDSWDEAISIRTLYKFSDSYKNVMNLSGYVRAGVTPFEEGKDYAILDFQIDLDNLPGPTEALVKIERGDIAAEFYNLAKQGKLFVYTYSKTLQDVYKLYGGGLAKASDVENYLSLTIEEPVTLVFTKTQLIFDIEDDDLTDDDEKDKEKDSDTDTGLTEETGVNPDTGFTLMITPVILIGFICLSCLIFGRRTAGRTRRRAAKINDIL